MQKGTIKRLVPDRGFGFIAPEGTEDQDLFFHANEVNSSFDDLREGDEVTFEEAEGKAGPDGEKRMNAVNVSVAS